MSNAVAGKAISLVLLDEHGLFRASLSRFLASQPGFHIAGECGSSGDAIDVLKSVAVDVVLLDFQLGPEQSDEFMASARQAGYKGRFLLVSASADARPVATVLMAPPAFS